MQIDLSMLRSTASQNQAHQNLAFLYWIRGAKIEFWRFIGDQLLIGSTVHSKSFEALNTNPVDATGKFLIAHWRLPATRLKRHWKQEWEMQWRWLPLQWRLIGEEDKFSSSLPCKSSRNDMYFLILRGLHERTVFWSTIVVRKVMNFILSLLLCCLNTASVVWNIFLFKIQFTSVLCKS